MNKLKMHLINKVDDNVTDDTVKAIAHSSYASDSIATNFEEIFVTDSPDTVRKVL